MRRRARPVDFSHTEPPAELLRFVPSAPGRWDPADFAAFLRAREAWRDTHAEPLPGLPARERIAMSQLNVPRGLVDAEKEASRGLRPPPFRQGVVWSTAPAGGGSETAGEAGAGEIT